MSTGTPESLIESEPVEQTETTAAEIAARSPLELFWRRLRRDKVALTLVEQGRADLVEIPDTGDIGKRDQERCAAFLSDSDQQAAEALR